jgi:HAD superfamily hydrolase (TIGR01549 family)
MADVQLERPRVLFLDAGNTVVYLDHAALAEAAARVGVVVDAAVLRVKEAVAKRHYEQAMNSGMSHDDGWHLHTRVLFEAAGVAFADAERAARAAWEAHDAFNLWRMVPDDFVAALERARAAGIGCAIISNAEGQISSLFAQLKILHLFDHVVDSGVEGVRKPDAEIFRRALARSGVRASEALYAGDIPQVDVEGARGAGMRAVLIDALDHYPDYRDAPRFRSVAELVSAFGV